MKALRRFIAWWIFPLFILFFVSCESTSTHKNLYYWGNYERQVYAFLNGESRVAQIPGLERDLATIEKNGYTAPPGFYAYLGLLYAEAGDEYKAITFFEAEKAHFPESAAFMDVLLRRYVK
jgi:hypothetical protein